MVRWQSTRVDLFRGEGKFRVVRLESARDGSTSDVTPEVCAGEWPGGFVEALVVARRVSRPGEMAQVRCFERDRRLQRRMVNTYRVQL